MFERVTKGFSCVRGELETEQNGNILTPTLIAITAFLSRSPGLFNRGPGGPVSLGHYPSSSIFSPTDLNFLSPELYNDLTSTYLLRAPRFRIQFNPLDSQGRPWSPGIFDRMHLLFTLVHFFFWQLGRVGGQYATIVAFIFKSYFLSSKVHIYVYHSAFVYFRSVVCQNCKTHINGYFFLSQNPIEFKESHSVGRILVSEYTICLYNQILFSCQIPSRLPFPPKVPRLVLLLC